jgi:hypothetical protein
MFVKILSFVRILTTSLIICWLWENVEEFRRARMGKNCGWEAMGKSVGGRLCFEHCGFCAFMNHEQVVRNPICCYSSEMNQ